jgi:hypothetical protein
MKIESDENPQMNSIDMLEPLIPGGNDDKYRTMKPMLYHDILHHEENTYDYDTRMYTSSKRNMKIAKFLRTAAVSWLELLKNSKYYEKIKDSVEKVEKNDFIYNAEYKDLKSRIESSIHTQYDEIKFLLDNALKMGIHNTEGFNDIYYDSAFHGSLHSLKSAIKKIEKWKKVYIRGHESQLINMYLERYKPFLEIAQYMDDLKGKIKMGREPKTPDPNAFTPPPTKSEDREKIAHIIKDFLEEIKNALTQMYTHNVKQAVETYLEYQKKHGEISVYKYIYEMRNPYLTVVLNGFENQTDFVSKRVNQLVEESIARFVEKNKQKLTHIVVQKGNLTKARIGKVIHSGYDISGDMSFEFSDNSSFKTTNKIVLVVNQRGTRFHRFPTTFHDIILNGQSYKMKSEEWMVNNFK